MTDKTTERQVNWAHSIMNDPSSTRELRRKASVVLSRHDPEALEQEEFYLDR